MWDNDYDSILAVHQYTALQTRKNFTSAIYKKFLQDN